MNSSSLNLDPSSSYHYQNEEIEDEVDLEDNHPNQQVVIYQQVVSHYRFLPILPAFLPVF